MNDEDARGMWTSMGDGEWAEVFEYYRHTCVEPVDSDVSIQAGNTHHVQPIEPLQQQEQPPMLPPPPSSSVIPHADQVVPLRVRPTLANDAPVIGSSNEPTQEDIINAIKVMHSCHYNSKTFMSDEEAWTLWMKWSIGEQQELLTSYQAVCAETQLGYEMNSQGGDHQAIHPVKWQDPTECGQHQARESPHSAAHVPMTVEQDPLEYGQHQTHKPPHGAANVQMAVEQDLHDDGQHQAYGLPQDAAHVPMVVEAHAPPSPANHSLGEHHLHPVSRPPPASQVHTGAPLHLAPLHNHAPEDRPSTLIQQQMPHSQPHSEHTGVQPLSRAGTLQAHSGHIGAPPHLAPQYEPLQPRVAGFGYHAGTAQGQQVQESQRPSRPPTVVSIRPPAGGHAPYGVGYSAPPPPQQQFRHDQSYTAMRPSSHQVPLQYHSQELMLQGADKHQLATGNWDIQQQLFARAHPPPNHQSPTSLGYPPRASPHEMWFPPQSFQNELLWSHPTQGSGSSSHPHPNSAPGLPQSQLQFQPELPSVGASASTQMYHPIPSRPGPPPAYFRGRTTSLQTTRTDGMDRLTEDTVTQHTMSFNDIEMWKDSQGGSFAGMTDFYRKPDKRKSRATDTDVNNFRREGLGESSMLEEDTHPEATSIGDTNVGLNQRPERSDVPQFINSDGTLLVINRLQGLSNAVEESAQAQKEFSQEFKLFQELYQKLCAGLPLGEKRQVQPQSAQQRKLNDNSLRSRIREKRVDDKVRRLHGQNRFNGDEADNEADDKDDGAVELRELLKEKEDFNRLKCRIRHSLTGFLGIYDWSTVADQYPTLTEQQLQDYKQRKESIVPTVAKNFRPDFHLPWKQHPFNKENRDVFIDKYLACVEGGAYFKNPMPKEMLTRECIGFVLDNHMRYCRDRWHKSLCPLLPETLAQLAKSAAQRSCQSTLHRSREVLVVRRGYTQHRLLMRLLDPCNMSGDETDGDEKTVDSKYRIIVSRWQSKELCRFLWTIDHYYRADWANPTHRRAMGGNRPRQHVLHEGYNEDGIVPAGLWRNCYDKDWLKEQPAFAIRELEIVDEDYDFSFTATVPPASTT